MYAGEIQQGSEGPVQIDNRTRISEAQGMWMHDTVQRLKPARSLEIGLAYGFSTLYILAAMSQTGTGQHLALDPFQFADKYRGVGSRHAEHVGMSSSFQLLQEFSSVALAKFAAQKDSFEFIYIDGNHRFDDVVVDFTLSADVCPVGGHIILDDLWMPAIQTAVSWIRTNRVDFREVPTPVANIAQFERIDRDPRPWDHYVKFSVAAARPSIGARIARRLRRMLAS